MMGHWYCQRSWQLLVPLPDLGCHTHAEGVAYALANAAERRSNSTDTGRRKRYARDRQDHSGEITAGAGGRRTHVADVVPREERPKACWWFAHEAEAWA